VTADSSSRAEQSQPHSDSAVIKSLVNESGRLVNGHRLLNP